MGSVKCLKSPFREIFYFEDVHFSRPGEKKKDSACGTKKNYFKLMKFCF